MSKNVDVKLACIFDVRKNRCPRPLSPKNQLLESGAFICINRNKIKARHLFDRSVYPLPTFRVVVLIIGAIKEILLLQVNMRRTLMGSAFLSEQSWLGANGDPLQGFWQQIYR
ncbi:hypothetical protein CDAR_620501 [Caerostris darwini]|uniref:Uncharacterized protein n=1 Tax=Caerostris darwini TaxID=1538125 RepID=A0AAV4VTA8_9ARAC|nr:hypothetical protein CDAR_620501 [Caerostris darwini]